MIFISDAIRLEPVVLVVLATLVVEVVVLVVWDVESGSKRTMSWTGNM